jgi:hypothetical protein
VLTPPKITSQPTGIATNTGVSVSFNVSASGSQPLSYQWFFISGGLTNLLATSQTNVLQLDNISTNDAGSYQVIVFNPVGSVTSSVATLTLSGEPIIIQPPTNTSVGLGSNATFSVVANGTDPLAYQWYYYQASTNLTTLFAATNASYTIISAQATNAGNYFVVVSNDFGSATSSAAILTVMTPPAILAQPTNVVTITNKAVSFIARVSGTAPLRATWWRSGLTSNSTLAFVSFTNTTVTTSFSGGNVQGAVATNQPGTQFMLNLLASYVSTTNAANYFVVVSNSMGVVTSSVASLSVLFPPKLTSQPANVATNPGATVFFNASATGSQPLNYQWFFISGGATNLLGSSQTNVLKLDNVSTNDAGSYQLVVTNPVGSVTSTAARLSILVNGASSAPYLWLLNHDPTGGDGIMIALESGRNYRVQASADLVNWTDVTNFLSHSSLVIYTNSDFTNLPSQFYRVVTP